MVLECALFGSGVGDEFPGFRQELECVKQFKVVLQIYQTFEDEGFHRFNLLQPLYGHIIVFHLVINGGKLNLRLVFYPLFIAFLYNRFQVDNGFLVFLLFGESLAFL